MNDKPQRPDTEVDPPPPVLGSWRSWYLLLVVELVVIILVSYGVTEAFR